MKNGPLDIVIVLGLSLALITISSCSKEASSPPATSSSARVSASQSTAQRAPEGPPAAQGTGLVALDPPQAKSAAPSTGIVPVCSGVNCAALSPTKYAGSGVGIWRYRNTSATDAVVDLDIEGVSAGKSVLALFSNGGQSAAKRAPGFPVTDAAVHASPALLPGHLAGAHSPLSKLSKTRRARDVAHDTMLRKNLDISRKLLQFKASMKQFRVEGSPAPAIPPAASTAVEGTTRTWMENFDQPIPYKVTVEKICPLAGGRRAVFWVDPAAKHLLIKTDPQRQKQTSALDAFVTAFCGPTGGYQKLVDLMGDPWGPAATNYPTLIHESANARLDVNIVIPNVTSGTKWGGYFSSVNNYSKKSYPMSNEALAFFANPTSIDASLPYMLSTLIHEMTHMINFYQRTIARGQSHGAWLEETSAMMSEDIVAPSIQPPPHYSNIESDRIPGYLATGGAVSYISWPQLSVPHYDLGGSFGAFVDRRFGTSIFSRLVDSCSDADDLSSYNCLDKILKDLGSVGLDDEFARFGATLFAGLGSTGVPAGFGYPRLESKPYTLDPIDIGTELDERPNSATTLQAGFPATAQTYHLDVIPEGTHVYKRSGIVVPAKTDLVVVVR